MKNSPKYDQFICNILFNGSINVLLFFVFAHSSFICAGVDTLSAPMIVQENRTIFNTKTPSFRWKEIFGANGYTLYINTSEKVVFESSNYGAITKVEYTIPENKLSSGEKYTIRLRAFNENEWSDYSDPIEFEIIEKKNRNLEFPRVITKNNVQINFAPDFGKGNLVWESVDDASYEIIIEGIKSSAIFGDEFTSLVQTTLLDTILSLDSTLFKNHDKYRWKIRSKNSNHVSNYSPYYYFRLNREENSQKENSVDEIVMRLKYAGFIDEMIIAKYKNGVILLPLTEIFSILQHNHEIDNMKGIIYGKQQNKSAEHFQINISKKELLIDELRIEIEDDEIEISDLEYFVSPKLFEKITSIITKIDMNNLSINLSSNFTLPFVQRKLNEQKLNLYKSRLQENHYPLLFDRERKYLSGGFIDYSASTTISNNKTSYNYVNLGVGAEIMGGDLEVHSQQSFQNTKLTFSQLNYKWRYAILKNQYISNISIGQNSILGLNSYDIYGIGISNEPVEPRKIYGKYSISENAEPNSQIEVYHNNQLIDIVNTDRVGDYKFEIPFNYGTTMLEIHEIGPSGNYNIKNKMYQITSEQIPRGQFDYSVNLGKLNNTNEYLLQTNSKYGVSKWLTTQIGAEVFTNDFSNSSIYSITTASFFENYIGNLTIAPNAFHEFSVNSIYNDLASFHLSAKLYEQNAKINPAKIHDELEGNVFIPLKINNDIMSFLIRGRLSDFSDLKRTDLSLRTFYNIGNISPSLEYEYFNLKDNFKTIESMYLNFRINYNLDISSSIFIGNILDARLNYDLTNSQIQSLNISLSTTVLNKFRVQLIHSRTFPNSYSDTQLRVIFDLPFFRSSTSFAKNNMSQSIIGSVNYNEHLNEFNFYNRGMVGRSAASFKFYADENMNNKYDSGEPLIPDMEVQVNSIGGKQRIDNGNVIISNLESYSIYDVKLVDKQNKNPLLFPEKEKFSFISDPHQFKEIQIPFYEAAEIIGSVHKKSVSNLIPIGGLNIFLINEESNQTLKIKTMSDGSFYHFGLKPGKYQIFIDKEQLEKMKLKPIPEIINGIVNSVRVSEDLTEFNFILE